MVVFTPLVLWLTYIQLMGCLIMEPDGDDQHSPKLTDFESSHNSVSSKRIRRSSMQPTSYEERFYKKFCDSGSFVLRIKPMDCDEYLQLGCQKSGVYRIWPRNKLMNGRSLEVFCDMGEIENPGSDGQYGGWTVIQRRGVHARPTDYFNGDWAAYKNGFGNIEEDFWLGNDNIFALTNQRKYCVRLDLYTTAGKYSYALYDIFYIGDEESKYKLTIQDFSGTANDFMLIHNGQKFSTKDQDNDNRTSMNCAMTYKGGWWYNACPAASLNGPFYEYETNKIGYGVKWNNSIGTVLYLSWAAIKIRPVDFRISFAKPFTSH